MEQYVELDTTRDGVAIVTLNRPDVHNAFNADVIEQLDNIFEDLRGADGVRVVQIRGAGKSFSAGADLNWMKRASDYTKDDNEEDAVFFSSMLHKLYDLPQLTIAAVQGPAVGGGLGLVAACDVAIATHKAWFCLSEVKLGLIPAVISPYVVEAIGPRAARRYFLTAERFDAEKAKDIGLLHEVVADGAAMNAVVDQLCETAFVTAPGAVHAAKELIRAVQDQPINNHIIHETAKRIAIARTSDEGCEGVGAFLDKRKPQWVADHEALTTSSGQTTSSEE